MKHFINLFFIASLTCRVIGQIPAYTEDGQKVYLYENFTWRYADNEYKENVESGIRKIEVREDGLVKIDFMINQRLLTFWNGKIYYNDLQPSEIEYHTNSYFAKSVGNIKKILLNKLTISFEYHENPIFKHSEGKIKSVKIGNKEYAFDYYENDFFEKTVGKLKAISCEHNSVEFEYHQNTFYPETDGKLKKIEGSIPGVKIRFQD